MSADDLADLTSLLLTGNRDAIVKMAQSEDATFMQALTAKLLVTAFNKSDVRIYMEVLNRVVGRPKESKSVELTGKDGATLGIDVTRTEMTLDEKIARADALAEARRIAQED